MAARAAASSLGTRVAGYIPIATWLRTYPRGWVRPDLIAGLTSWAVMVPVAMGYAELAGVPPQVGLVTAFAALFAYAIFGTSRHVKVTTSSTMAIMSASVVGPLAAGDPARFLELTAALALVVGAILLAAGLARLGFMANFLAKSVITGFVFGLAVTIVIGQLPNLLGVEGGGVGTLQQFATVVEQLGDLNPWTLAVGGSALAGILLLKARFPKFPGSLIAVGLGILAVSVFNLRLHGVEVVGVVPTDVPTPSLPQVGLLDLPFLAAGAAGIVFLAVGESVGAARAYAARHRYEVDPDQELIGLGAANASSGIFGGFTVDVSLSQSATGEAAGARSQVSSLITSGLVLATAIVLAPLFRNLPSAILAAIVIASVLGLINVDEVRRYFATRRTDAILAIVALVGVVTTTVLVGLVIAVFLSLVLLLYRASRPTVEVMGPLARLPGTYVALERHPKARPIPGLLMLRVDGPLYFFNASAARDAVLAATDAAEPRPTAVLIDLGATADFDITTLDLVDTLVRDLQERSVDVLLAQVKGPVRDRMRRSGLMDVVGEERVYLSVEAAVASFRERTRRPERTPDTPPGSEPEPQPVDSPA